MNNSAIPRRSRADRLTVAAAGLVAALLLASIGLPGPAQALTIVNQGGDLNGTITNDAGANPSTNSNNTVSLTDSTLTGGSVSVSFARFTATTGVLTAAKVDLLSNIQYQLSGNGNGGSTAIQSATGTGSIAYTVATALGDSQPLTFGPISKGCATTASNNCSYDTTLTTTALNGTLNVAAGNLNNYVGAGTYTASGTLNSITASITNVSYSNADATFVLGTWVGTLADGTDAGTVVEGLRTTYTYLLHANPSFSNSAQTLTLNLNNASFDPDGVIKQGDGGGSLSVGYTLFNYLNGFLTGDRVGLNLTSITPGGGNSTQTTTNLATFSGLAAGNTGNNFTAFLNTTQLGTFTSTFTVHLHDNCTGTHAGDTCLADSDLTLNITGTVSEPLPPTVMLMVAGLLALGGTYWARLRRQGVRA